MIEVALQRVDKDTLKAFSDEDGEAIREFPLHKILRAKITGAMKPRSYEQLKLYWLLCRLVAENTEDQNWNDPVKVDHQVKIKCRHIKEYIVVDGTVHIIPGSISYAEMSALEANNFFDRAFVEMAKHLGITRDELLANAE